MLQSSLGSFGCDAAVRCRCRGYTNIVISIGNSESCQSWTMQGSSMLCRGLRYFALCVLLQLSGSSIATITIGARVLSMGWGETGSSGETELSGHSRSLWGVRSRRRAREWPHVSLFNVPAGRCLALNNFSVVRDRAVVISGREGPPVDDYEPNSSLALFDLTTNRWIAHYDVDGYLSRRIGHSAVTVEDTTIVFGGELVDYVPDIALKSLNDTYRLSFREQVLRCEHICTNTSSEETDVLEQPPPRAWHASVSVKIPHATDTSEPLAATIGMLVLGGKGSSGNHLADVWLLTVAADKDQRWSQLSV